MADAKRREKIFEEHDVVDKIVEAKEVLEDKKKEDVRIEQKNKEFSKSLRK